MFELLSWIPWYINVICVPVLLVIAFIGLFLVIKPQNKNYLLKLYSILSDMLGIIGESYNGKTLKILNSKIRSALNCCDYLLGGDMYEMENITALLDKASNILIAMQVAKIPVDKYKDYLPRVDEQIEHAKNLISSFYMEDTVAEMKYNNVKPRKNKQSAKDYLDDLK